MRARRIFISHEQHDKALADAWSSLLASLSDGDVEVWHSSDQRLDGGMSLGAWRPQIMGQLLDADDVLMILTPSSNERPWIVWECGAAHGAKKTIIPVLYFLNQADLHPVHSGNQNFAGEQPEAVRRLCGHLLRDMSASAIDDATWEDPWGAYSETVAQQRRLSVRRRLFHHQFHTDSAASVMAKSGPWHAIWSRIDGDGHEAIFESDVIEVVRGPRDRVRLLGRDTKAGLEMINTDGELDFYPMEGVISRDGALALTYWNAGGATYCGTALLKSIGGTRYEGSWCGYEAESVTSDPEYVQGRVVMMTSRDAVFARWKEMSKR